MGRDGIPVTQLMTRGVLTVTADTSISDAAGTLLEEGVGSLVVVDGDGRPVGMFTNTDLAEFVSTGDFGAEPTVAQYMTNRVITVDTRSSIRDAAAKMIANGIHHLPVIDDDDDGVVGMLSTMDLTAYSSYTSGSDAE
jgi:CBS domain-containing protein